MRETVSVYRRQRHFGWWPMLDSGKEKEFFPKVYIENDESRGTDSVLIHSFSTDERTSYVRYFETI